MDLVVAHMESSPTTVEDKDRRSVDAMSSRTRCFRPLVLELNKSHLAGSRYCTLLIPKIPAIAVDDSVLTAGTDVELSTATLVYPDGFIPETVTMSLAATGF